MHISYREVFHLQTHLGNKYYSGLVSMDVSHVRCMPKKQTKKLQKPVSTAVLWGSNPDLKRVIKTLIMRVHWFATTEESTHGWMISFWTNQITGTIPWRTRPIKNATVTLCCIPLELTKDFWISTPPSVHFLLSTPL